MKLDWKALLGILVSVGLLWWLFKDQDLGLILEQVKAADPWLLLIATVIVITAYVIRAWRWKLLLEPLAPNTRFYSRWATTLIGFMANNILPARMGEFIRAFAISKEEPVPVSGAFGSLVVARFLDGIAVVALLVVAVVSPSFPTGVEVFGQSLVVFVRGIVLTLVALLVGISVLVVWPAAARWTVGHVGRVLPAPWGERLAQMTDHFLDGLAVLRDPMLFAKSLFLSMLHWTYYGFSFWLGMRAFGINLGYGAALFTQSMVAFGAAIPSAPGFFGTWHAAARVALVDAYGVAEPTALAFATSYHLIGFLPITVLGLYYAWRMGISVTSAGEQSTDTPEAA